MFEHLVRVFQHDDLGLALLRRSTLRLLFILVPQAMPKCCQDGATAVALYFTAHIPVDFRSSASKTLIPRALRMTNVNQGCQESSVM